MNKIQVGFLVSYDYELLKNAIPLVYKQADTIYLALDKDRKTWNGETIEIADNFFDWIRAYDTDKKIHLYEDQFYVKDLSTMQCEVRERKMLANKMGIGNWIIQLDADEYFINFKRFVTYLRTKTRLLINPEKHPVQIQPFHVSLYKKVDEGYLYVDEATKTVVATNYPEYTVGRKTKGQVIYFNALILHECLARNRDDLLQKLTNWGHNNDFDIEAFMKKWDGVNEHNYKEKENFFFLEPEKWKYLDFVKGKNFKELFDNFKIEKEQGLYKTKFFIIKKNIGQFFRYHFKKKSF
ncbi:hypothetical protein KFZ70_11085 [Tamlana fucoidanivorans]|uniref:Glycosyltransferase family 2 protein n=1 Tax=Allotamlana fucoidanivorans TaxID=2583814 RepID=A0A5C4SHL2_9FLAO|nr:hypothetical protein [Tamlana fucoidanivorans]TNJ43177.1 hypothetical protein FGF67_12550 [Tamlana fucoidanivorans]